MDGGASFVGPDHVIGSAGRVRPRILIRPRADFIGQPPNQFRTNTVRAIAADPTRPGTVYATEAKLVADPTGNVVPDPADIVFARSIDYGVTWQRTFWVGPSTTHILNDDNDGQSVTGLNPDDVITNQALPRLTVDAQGTVAVIWYDTRRDPRNHLLDVFGTVSTDGGLTFSPNFRITDQSFDADAGTSPTRQVRRMITWAISSAWPWRTRRSTPPGPTPATATRTSSSRASRSARPRPPNDRFEPNNTPETATDLGTVIERPHAQAGESPGDEGLVPPQGRLHGQPDRLGHTVRCDDSPAPRVVGCERDDATGDRDGRSGPGR